MLPDMMPSPPRSLLTVSLAFSLLLVVAVSSKAAEVQSAAVLSASLNLTVVGNVSLNVTPQSISGDGLGRVYFVTTSSPTIGVVDLATGQQLLPVNFSSPSFMKQFNLTSLPLLSLVCTDGMGQLHTYDYLNGVVISLLPNGTWLSVMRNANTSRITSMAVSSAGDLLVLSSTSTQVNVYSLPSGTHLYTIPYLTSSGVAISAANHVFLGTASPGSIMEYDPTGSFIAYHQPVNASMFPISPYAVLVAADGVLIFSQRVVQLCSLSLAMDYSCISIPSLIRGVQTLARGSGLSVVAVADNALLVLADSSSPPPPGSGSSSPSGGVVAAIVVSVLIVTLLLAAVLIWVVRRRKRAHEVEVLDGRELGAAWNRVY